MLYALETGVHPRDTPVTPTTSKSNIEAFSLPTA